MPGLCAHRTLREYRATRPARGRCSARRSWAHRKSPVSRRLLASSRATTRESCRRALSSSSVVAVSKNAVSKCNNRGCDAIWKNYDGVRICLCGVCLIVSPLNWHWLRGRRTGRARCAPQRERGTRAPALARGQGRPPRTGSHASRPDWLRPVRRAHARARGRQRRRHARARARRGTVRFSVPATAVLTPPASQLPATAKVPPICLLQLRPPRQPRAARGGA